MSDFSAAKHTLQEKLDQINDYLNGAMARIRLIKNEHAHWDGRRDGALNLEEFQAYEAIICRLEIMRTEMESMKESLETRRAETESRVSPE